MNQQVKHTANYHYKNNSKQAPPLARTKGQLTGCAGHEQDWGHEDTELCMYVQVSSFNCEEGNVQMPAEKNVSHKLGTKMCLL